MKLIDKDDLVAEIKKLQEEIESQDFAAYTEAYIVGVKHTLETISDILDTLEVKEVDLELITGWFDHIAQIADDRMTLTNQRMTDAHALDEIKCLARNSSEFIKMHYKAKKGE